MANIEDLLKETASAFIGDCFRIGKIATAPARIALNEVESVL